MVSIFLLVFFFSMFDFLVARKEGKGRDMGNNGGEDGEGGIGMIASEKGMGAPPPKKRDKHTLPLICPKFTPNSSINGGSPSYPSVPNAANQPVLNPP